VFSRKRLYSVLDLRLVRLCLQVVNQVFQFRHDFQFNTSFLIRFLKFLLSHKCDSIFINRLFSLNEARKVRDVRVIRQRNMSKNLPVVLPGNGVLIVAFNPDGASEDGLPYLLSHDFIRDIEKAPQGNAGIFPHLKCFHQAGVPVRLVAVPKGNGDILYHAGGEIIGPFLHPLPRNFEEHIRVLRVNEFPGVNKLLPKLLRPLRLEVPLRGREMQGHLVSVVLVNPLPGFFVLLK